MPKKTETKKVTDQPGKPSPPRRKLTLQRFLWTLILLFLPLPFLPRWWCGHEADGWYRGETSSQLPLARHVKDMVTTGVGIDDFSTGSKRFDGEWLFGTYMMSGMGLCQVVLAHPETSTEFTPAIKACIDSLLEERSREFDTEAWGNDALATLEQGKGHAAYLGYLNLLLGLYRKLEPGNDYAVLNDRITEALARRLSLSTIGLIETYPDEVYPVDNAACVGGIALHHEVTGKGYPDVLKAAYAVFRNRYIDSESGMLFQAVDNADGDPIDKPRGSGTALAAYFLSFGRDPSLGRELYQSLRIKHSGGIVGFGYVEEYPDSVEAGYGDIDSGPVVFGMSFSGTGFAMGPARMHGDREFYIMIYRSLYIVGAPYDSQRKRQFVTGGPIGNTIMLAMLTAQPLAVMGDAK